MTTTARKTLPLAELVPLFCRARGLNPVTESRYQNVVRMFGRCLGREVSTADLSEENVEAFGAALSRDKLRTSVSVINYKSNLRTLWRFADNYGLPVKPAPNQWSLNCVRRCNLPDAAAGLDGDRTLAKLVALYPTYREISAKYMESLQYVLVLFTRFLDRPPTLDDLNDLTINEFVTWYQQGGRRAESVANQRRLILTVWRFAEYLDLVNTLPRRIKKIRRPYILVEAWSTEQVATILAAAAQYDPVVRNHWPLTWGQLLGATVLLGVNSALRPGDLLAAKWSNVCGSGLTIVQHKTGSPVSMELWPETLAALESIRHGSEYLVGGRTALKHLQKRFQELLRRAGIPGSLRILRKCAATWASEQGLASQLLGHRSGSALAQKHYIDARKAVVRPAQPVGLVNGPAAALPVPSASADSVPWGVVVNTWSPDAAGKDGVA